MKGNLFGNGNKNSPNNIVQHKKSLVSLNNINRKYFILILNINEH